MSSVDDGSNASRSSGPLRREATCIQSTVSRVQFSSQSFLRWPGSGRESASPHRGQSPAVSASKPSLPASCCRLANSDPSATRRAASSHVEPWRPNARVNACFCVAATNSGLVSQTARTMASRSEDARASVNSNLRFRCRFSAGVRSKPGGQSTKTTDEPRFDDGRDNYCRVVERLSLVADTSPWEAGW